MDFVPPALQLEGRADGQLASLGKVLRDPLGNWPACLLWTGMERATAAGRPVSFVAEPAVVHAILLNRCGHFPRARIHDRILGAGYGANLVQADHREWRPQRHALARPIAAERAIALGPRIARAGRAMLDEWGDCAPGSPIPLVRDARRLALDALFRAIFATQAEVDRRDAQSDAIARRIAASPAGDLAHELGILVELADRLLDEASFRAGDSGAPPYPQDRNTLVLFLHAGHDNVAAALVWMLWLVAHRPDLQDKVAREWREGGATFDALTALDTAQAILKETLRLYPPVMQLVRDIEVDTAIGDLSLASGSSAILSIYAMQRQRTIWEDADAFLPERFLIDDRLPARQREAYLPFGSGPRGCIGASLARVELTLFLALVCDRFEIAPNPACPLIPEVEWTLRPTGAAPILLRPRS